MPGLVFGIDPDPLPSNCCSRLYSVGIPGSMILMEMPEPRAPNASLVPSFSSTL
jgi:hypothetical protein